MIGLCIVTHGELAFGLKDSCELIAGEQDQFAIVGLRHGDDFDEFKVNVYDSIANIHDGKGVLVLVDLFGASPYNSILFNYPKFKANNINVRMISGVNLAMVLEACEARTTLELEEVFIKVLQTGKEYIIGIDEAMNEIT